MIVSGTKHIRHFCGLIAGMLFLILSTTGCSLPFGIGSPAPQQINDLMNKYYQIAAHQSYDDLFDSSMSIGNLTINGFECLDLQGNIAMSRVRCEGFLFDADQTRGIVSSYTIESYTLMSNSVEASADVNVQRNGKGYQEHFQFFKDGQAWVIGEIKV